MPRVWGWFLVMMARVLGPGVGVLWVIMSCGLVGVVHVHWCHPRVGGLGALRGRPMLNSV